MRIHGYSTYENHFISGYRLNSTDYLSAVYNDTQGVGNQYLQMPGVFGIGKYILFTAIHSLPSDGNSINMFQHLYNLERTFIDSSSVLLPSDSSTNSDFDEILFIGTQKTLGVEEHSSHNIGYLRYFSGSISTQHRLDIVSQLSESWN